jgi:hypothetical protein
MQPELRRSIVTRFRIDATWYLDGEDPCVEVVFEIVEPLPPEHAQHLSARGVLAEADEPVARRELGRLKVENLNRMTEKRVRAQALGWLRERAGMTPEDSYELRITTKADLDVLARIETAVAQS